MALQLRPKSGLCMRLLWQMYIRPGLRCAQLEFLSALNWFVFFGQGRWQKLQVLIVDRKRLEFARCWHELESERWSDTETERLELDEERVGVHGLDRRRSGKEVLPQMFSQISRRTRALTSTSLPSGDNASALFQIPGFDFAYISVDLMHCVDLGVVQYLCGCALHEVFLELGGSESAPSEVLQYFLVLIKQAGKALAFSQPAVIELSRSMIHTTGAPKMKTKASEGRKLLSSSSVCSSTWCRKTLITPHFVFIASSSLPKSIRRCHRGAPTQAFALLSWDVKRWLFVESCRWKTCEASCGNVGVGCCTSCTPR